MIHVENKSKYLFWDNKKMDGPGWLNKHRDLLSMEIFRRLGQNSA